MTSVTLVQCFTNEAITPTGTWSHCQFTLLVRGFFQALISQALKLFIELQWSSMSCPFHWRAWCGRVFCSYSCFLLTIIFTSLLQPLSYLLAFFRLLLLSGAESLATGMVQVNHHIPTWWCPLTTTTRIHVFFPLLCKFF